MEKKMNSRDLPEIRHIVLNSTPRIEWHLREIEKSLAKIRLLLLQIEMAVKIDDKNNNKRRENYG